MFLTLVETLDDREDYGAYESVWSALGRFRSERRGALAARAVHGLLRRAPELAPDLLAQIAEDDDAAAAFNRAIPDVADAGQRRELAALIAREEGPDGCWLTQPDRRGNLVA